MNNNNFLGNSLTNSILIKLSYAILILTLITVFSKAQPFAYVTNSSSDDVSVIDISTNSVVANVSVGNYPFGIAITPDGSYVYVTNANSGDVSVISTINNTVVTTINLGAGSNPEEIAITPDGAFAYVVNRSGNNVLVIDIATNTITANISVGTDPRGITITPIGDYVYVTNSGNGDVSVIETATNTIATTIHVGYSPDGLDITPDGAFVFVTGGVNTSFVYKIATATNTIDATISAGSWPRGVKITPNGDFAYVTNSHSNSNSVSVIDVATTTVVNTVIVGDNPHGIDITPDGAYAYVVNQNSSDVSVIQIPINIIVATVDVGAIPISIDIAPDSAIVIFNHDPNIVSIQDVINDQGRQVRVSWTKSNLDTSGGNPSITEYSLWRRIDTLPENSITMTNQEKLNHKINNFNNNEGQHPNEILKLLNNDFPSGEWDYIQSVPAIGIEIYNIVAPTMADSTITYGMHWSVFIVIAHTQELLFYYVSVPDSGYSLDNLAPQAPTRLIAVSEYNSIALTWDMVSDEDFNYFVIYRNTESGIDPNFVEPYTSTIDTFFIDNEVDAGIEYYYRISAFDYSGNESELSIEVNETVLNVQDQSNIPLNYALLQNYPNPFNVTTKITYQLQIATKVNLSIYNVYGQLVEILVDENMGAGLQTVELNSRGASSGIYLYKMEAVGFSKIKKCVLVK